jgi:peptidyl-prolyl cis-trans isomerase B (cyclophilin B)
MSVSPTLPSPSSNPNRHLHAGSAPELRLFVKSAFLLLFLTLALASQGLAATREIATIKTSKGTMEFELFGDANPRTVANFKYLADTRFYDGTAFHRIVKSFMAQGGDPYTRYTNAELIPYYGSGSPLYVIPDELAAVTRPELSHTPGTLSMANSGPNSGGSQFFIMFGGAAELDSKHATFGRLISGSATLSAIEQTPVQPNARDEQSSPVERVSVESVRIRSVVSGPLSTTVPSGTATGLIWNFNREIRGRYRLSVQPSGTFSGSIQYLRSVSGGFLNQISSFSGTLAPSSAGSPDLLATLPPFSPDGGATLVRIQVRLRNRNNPAGDVSLTLCDVTKDGTEILDQNAFHAAGRLQSDALFPELAAARGALATCAPRATRYTGVASAWRADLGDAQAAQLARSPITLDSQEGGFLTLTRAGNSSYFAGVLILANGNRMTLGFIPSDEGGRILLPLYSFNGYVLLRGDLEIPPESAAERAKFPQFLHGELFWWRSNLGAKKLVVSLAPWAPPQPGQFPAPFASGNGQLQAGTSETTPTRFRFDSDASRISFPTGNLRRLQLQFRPEDGTFSGSLNLPTDRPSLTRSVRGVILQEGGYDRAIGFVPLQGGSLQTTRPVVLTPVP